MDILLFLLVQIAILAIYGFIIFISARLLPGVEIENYSIAFIVALVLTCLNLLVKPILMILALPITILTLGLFTWVINALILVFSSKLVDGFEIKNFGWAMLMSLIMGIFKMFAVISFPFLYFFTTQQKPRQIALSGFSNWCLAMTYSHMGMPHTTIGDRPFHC